MTPIDLNADLGEGVRADDGTEPERLDDLLLHQVSSANVACGGHAGDVASMTRVCRIATERGVAIGAQVSYVDRRGFGRTRLAVPHEVLVLQLADQLSALRVVASAVGGVVTYVKPHGALYNAAVDDALVAAAVVEAVDLDAEHHGHAPYPILTLPGSQLAASAAAHGIRAVAEAFADRAYTSDGHLVPRAVDGAVISDPDAVVHRAVRLAVDGVVTAHDGTEIQVAARSICLHSDTPGAAATAALVRTALRDAGVEVAPFTEQQ